MRELFISEYEYLSSLIYQETKKTMCKNLKVISEAYIEPGVLQRSLLRGKDRKKPIPIKPVKQHFNCDFDIYFEEYADRAHRAECRGIVMSLLPYTLGCELILHLDRDGVSPMYMELVGGEAFSIKYYKRYINEIEEKIDSLLHAKNQLLPSRWFPGSWFSSRISPDSWFPSSDQFSQATTHDILNSTDLSGARVPLKKMKYLRIFVLRDKIFFLSFKSMTKPAHIGTRYSILDKDGERIDCCFEEKELVCLDGWIKTAPAAPSDRYLLAEHL